MLRHSPQPRNDSPSPCSSARFESLDYRSASRTDNGVPFASAHALYGLSKLAVWWLRLGIRIERIKPGHPQQNGRHERIWLVTFMQYDPGYFDDEACRLEPIENPFGPKVLPMCSAE
jgi:transposase InsO family protein